LPQRSLYSRLLHAAVRRWGCAQSTADEVRRTQISARPSAYLGGGDDTLTAPDYGGWIVYGEPGSDRPAGGAGADTFFGDVLLVAKVSLTLRP
jgi:hypothetical protein